MLDSTNQPLLVSNDINTGIFSDPSPLTSTIPAQQPTGTSASVIPTSNNLTAIQTSSSIIPLSAPVQSALTTSPVVAQQTAPTGLDPLLGTPVVVNDSDIITNSALYKVQYSGNWNVSSDEGAYQQDVHWTDNIGATYQVKFFGSQIQLFGAKAPWHGIAGISIDGGTETLVDTFSASGLIKSILYVSPTLTSDFHTLTVRVTGQKNAQANGVNLLIDKLEIAGANISTTSPPSIQSTRIIDDQDLGTGPNQVKYTGVWNIGEGSYAYAGSNHWTNNTNATYEAQFYGSQVRLFGGKAPWHGIAAISIDGGTETLVDTYGGGFHTTLLYANTALNEGLHTIKVRVTGQKSVNAVDTNLLLDRLEVSSSLPTVASSAPKILSTQLIDDRDIGTGLNQIKYTGTWNLGTSTNAFKGQNSWTNETGAVYEAKFSGSQIKLYGGKAEWHGIAGISIDGGAETLVDTYGQGFENNVLLYANSTLTQGTHTIKVRVTGQRTAKSTNTYLLLDKLEVTNTDSNLVTPTSSFLNFSPYNWLPVGDAAQSSNSGAYFKFRFNGTQAILNVDTRNQTSFPLLDVFVDGQKSASELWLKNAANGQVQIFSGTAGDHDAVVYFRRREFLDGTDPAVVAARSNDWSTDAQHLRVTGVTINGGTGFLDNPFGRSKRAVFFGDSITEGGIQSYGPGPDRPPNFFDTNIPQNASYLTYAARLGDLLDVDYGQIGWSGSGWLRPTTPSGEPPFLDSWLRYNGQSTTTRNFTPQPDYVFVNLGTNDYPFNTSETGLNFNVTNTAYNWLKSARTLMPTADIFVINPFNLSKTDQLQAAITKYKNDFPTDLKVRFLNLGNEGAKGLQSEYLPEVSVDRVHPTANRHQELAGYLFNQIQPYLGSPITRINDSDTASGSGLNTIFYNGIWNRNIQAGAFGLDNHGSKLAGSNFQTTFWGNQVKLYGSKASTNGILGLSIDGGTEILIDTFNSTALGNALLYQSGSLSSGFHTLTLRVTGQRNTLATDSFIIFDRLDVLS